jgi:hypothetical protein
MVIMRALIVIAGAVLLIGSSAYAGGDKSQNAMVDASSQNGGSNGFTNGTTAAKIKSGKCLLSGGIKGLTGFADGDIAICIGSATVLGTPLGPNTPLGNAAIIRAVAKAGQLKFKADLTKVGCGSLATTTKVVSFNPGFECYKPNAAFTDPATPGTNWHASCSGIALDNPDATAASDPAKVNLLGVCQAAAGAGNPQGGPGTGKIGQTGLTIVSYLP